MIAVGDSAWITDVAARRLFVVSLVYLPLLFALLAVDGA